MKRRGGDLFVTGSALFAKRSKRDGPAQHFKVEVRRESWVEANERQAAFGDDVAYIEANLMPGKPKFIQQVSNGA